LGQQRTDLREIHPQGARHRTPEMTPTTDRRRTTMNLDRAVMAFAGVMILASVALAHFVSPWWLLLTAFIGLNMLQASFTGFCPASMLFARLGVKAGCAFKQAGVKMRKLGWILASALLLL